MKLAHFDTPTFLRDYWQKRPLLIRNPWEAWRNPLDPDELAGLACEEHVESRLIVREGERLALESGPLPEHRFGELAGATATLLVQAVDHHVPEVAALIEAFRFVPDWRIDDVMVSYAVTGGGVGAHFDQYDVFLIQGLGRRRWQVGPICDAATPLLPHEDLRLIADFAATEEWILEPGDILYLPPRYAHDGVALSDDCMTYSIGFRAPSLTELIEGWAEHQADTLPDDLRYCDPDLAVQDNPGEITPRSLDRLHALVLGALGDRAEFARWFGTHTSQPKYPEIDWRPDEPIAQAEVAALLAEGASLQRNPASRFSYIRADGGRNVLFVDGEAYDCAGEIASFAPLLCAAPLMQVPSALRQSPEVVALVTTLVNQGSLGFDEDEC